MKVIRVHAYGQPPQVDDVPEPQATGPDDVVVVVVRIGGAGLCRTDLHITDRWFADVIPAQLPVVLGHENSGWVYAVGPAVEHLAVGDPVICHPNLTWRVPRLPDRRHHAMREGSQPPVVVEEGAAHGPFKGTVIESRSDYRLVGGLISTPQPVLASA